MKVGLSKEEIELLGREGHNGPKLVVAIYLLLLPPEKMAQHRCFNDDYCGACRN